MEHERQEAPDGAREVTIDELRSFLADPGATVVDVLTPEAYRAAHIPGSISLPLAEIEARAAEVLPDREKPVVVYCAADT